MTTPPRRLSIALRAAIADHCAGRVSHVVETGQRSFWTLRQTRFALRQERGLVLARWPLWRRHASRLWYMACETVCGCKVTRLRDTRQVALPATDR